MTPRVKLDEPHRTAMPSIDLTRDELADLIERAAEAHHIYEQQELDGERDEDWAGWYADWILDELDA